MGGFTSQKKQTDREIPQGGALSMTIILVAIDGILGELGNGVDRSLFADDLARNQRVAARALQGATNRLDTWAVERGKTFSTSKPVNMVFRKRNYEMKSYHTQ